MMRKLFYRPYEIVNFNGLRTVSSSALEECLCKENQRGPKGGVCGGCGKAIPSDSELLEIRQQEEGQRELKVQKAKEKAINEYHKNRF